MTKSIFFFVLFFCFLNSIPCVAQVDPAIEWKVQHDDYAIWVYDSRHRDLAEQYAKNFRRLLPQIQRVFHELPEKTTFVIADITDRPNGSATVFPYPLVTIYPVIPLPHSPIGETDDSLYEILAHEYTHILNLYPVHGGMRALSWIFGSIVRPNGYLPRWYAEGLAVFTESYFTPGGGRLRSQNFEGMARAIGQNKEWSLYPVDTLNDFEPDWLGGRRAYLLGGALMYELAMSHGIEKIDDLNQAYSRRIPYFINGPVKERTQNVFSELLDDAYQRLQKSIDEQLRSIATQKITQGTPLSDQGFFSTRPAISPNGQFLAFIARDHNVPSSIQLRTRKPSGDWDESFRQIAFGVDINDLAWSPDSKKIVYNSVETYKRFYQFSDLSLYDLAQKKTTRLTSGARVGDFVFSPAGDALYFVQNRPGAKRLAKLDLQKKIISVIYTPVRSGINLYSLVIENNYLLFLEQQSDQRRLVKLALDSPSPITVIEDTQITALRKTHQGFLYTSSVSGVDNLYWTPSLLRADTLRSQAAITNSRTRIMDGEIDPLNRSLLYTEQTSRGHLIFVQTEKEWSQIQGAPQVTPLLPLNTEKKEPEWTAARPTFSDKENNYSATPYLWPRYWMPFGNVIDGGLSFQASTGAQDPLRKHSYNLMAEWDTLTQKTGWSGSYSNTTTPVQWGLGASQVYRYNYTTETALRDTSGQVSASYDLPFMLKTWTFTTSWRWSETEFTNTVYQRSGPSLSLGFSNAIQRGYEISPMSGMSASLSHQAFISEFGNIGYGKTNLNFKKYFSEWLPENNAIFFQLNGVLAEQLKFTPGKSPDILGFYTSTLNGNYFNNLLIPPFLVRGYTSGTLLGYNMVASNLEYRFPIARVFRGWDTVPFFIKRLHGAVISDVVSLDGFRRSNRTGGFLRQRLGDEWYLGYGAELNIECTIGYYLPATFSFGVYRGDNRDLATDDLSYFFVFRF